ncbi:MAG: 3-phosphoglycerate dehydrogenase [Proteobacteria bacterium]|nr:3-phosphoglycerate dehydrogenase [Pseudomonadota bacterium]
MTKPVYIDCSANIRQVLEDLGAIDSLAIHHGDPTPAEIAKLIEDAEIVLNGHTVMADAIIGGAKRLKCILFLGTGASTFLDIAATEARGIRVRTIKGYGDRTIAEHAFGLLLAAARTTTRMDREIRAGVWVPREGVELQGLTLGLVGLGGVGSEMARIASAFGMRVVAWNRSGVPAGVPAAAMELDEVLSIADAVSLHVSLTPETRGLIDATRLNRMKPGAILVNTARGAVVDEAALIEALRSGHLGHAALDVFGTEPLPRGHVLAGLDNVTLSAHAAWNSRAAARRLMQMALAIVEEEKARIAA